MRELVVLGTASQVPTRYRNHNGYLLRWDDEVILFDPGEGTQRQMLMAGLSVSPLTRICVTHFHGDHSLGLAGVIQRISLDRVPHPVAVHFPAGGREFFDRLRHATSFWDNSDLRPEPVGRRAARSETSAGRLTALPLRHSIETYGYRLVEPDGRRMVPELLAAHGIAGPAVGELQRTGRLGAGHPGSGERAAARPALRVRHGHRPVRQRVRPGRRRRHAGHRVDVPGRGRRDGRPGRPPDGGPGRRGGPASAGYGRWCSPTSPSGTPTRRRFLDEARPEFDGDIVVAEDLMRVPVPPRLPSDDDRASCVPEMI